MGVMVSEVYDALIEAGSSPEKARAAAEAIPATEQQAVTHSQVGWMRSGQAHQGGTNFR